MRKNFNIRNRGRRWSKVSKKILIVAVFTLFLIILQIVGTRPLREVAHFFARPLWQIQGSLLEEVRDFASLLDSKKQLVEEKKELARQLQVLQPSAALIDALKKENDELKLLLGREGAGNTILAAVLAKPAVSLYDTLVLDVGRSDGVAEGDLVLVYGEFVIGTVTEVFQSSAVVTLFSSGGRETDVTLGENHLLVTAEGRGGGNFKTQVPRGITVTPGDIVILPNISTQVFGVVERVVATPADQFQTILFKNPVNIAEVNWVEVVRSGR